MAVLERIFFAWCCARIKAYSAFANPDCPLPSRHSRTAARKARGPSPFANVRTRELSVRLDPYGFLERRIRIGKEGKAWEIRFKSPFPFRQTFSSSTTASKCCSRVSRSPSSTEVPSVAWNPPLLSTAARIESETLSRSIHRTRCWGRVLLIIFLDCPLVLLASLSQDYFPGRAALLKSGDCRKRGQQCQGIPYKTRGDVAISGSG